MLSIDPKSLPVPKLHAYLLGAIAPRPICFASTIDKAGNINLAPFSFFNVFGSNPPLLIFSPARRGRENTVKHTFENVLDVKEVVINIVDYKMVQQMSLASTEYPKGVNEFEKAGLTMLKSECILPPRVAEAPVQLECKVTNIIETGNQGGAGNLIFAEVIRLHIKDHVLDKQGKIDPFLIDQVARLGGDWYCRAKLGLFEVEKPLTTLGIGVDNIPHHVRFSEILSGNDLGQLGNIEKLPTQFEIQDFINSDYYQSLLKGLGTTISNLSTNSHLMAKKLIAEKQIHNAWCVLLSEQI